MPVNHFTLSIKDASGNDMLNPNTPGAYLQGNIKVSYGQGTSKKLTDVRVREPFTYGDGPVNKFAYYTLVSSELGNPVAYQKVNEFNLDFGDGINRLLTVDQQAGSVSMNGKQLPADNNLPLSAGKVYYLVKDK